MMHTVYTFMDDRSIPILSAYATPLLAALMQPVHDFDRPQGLTPCAGLADVVYTDGLRLKGLLFDRAPVPITLPLISSTTRTAFAVLLARSVYANPDFLWWADGWISGRDRTRATAYEMLSRPLPSNDRAYVAHWAGMSAAFPHEHTLAAQTAALIVAYVSHSVDFATVADAALAIA